MKRGEKESFLKMKKLKITFITEGNKHTKTEAKGTEKDAKEN